MWKYSETDAYNTIGLHDCKSDNIRIEGADLIFEFPDGYKICPGNKHNEKISCNDRCGSALFSWIV